jgi:outer membrane protein OmpA-like peptidoglycan-associated protein
MMAMSRLLAATIITMLTVAGCSGDQPTAAGRRTAVDATLGAIAGGAAGAAIDKNDVRGPLIGAAIGAAVGGGIGYALDRQQAELEQALERERAAQQATVERVTDEQLKVTISDQVAFDYKSTAIRPDFLPTIEHVADVLARYDTSQVLVVGHSDAVGSDSYNRELSLARADAVRDALAVYGVDPARIQAEGRGEAEPRASNDSEAGRASNRRVEILITSTA